MHWNQRRILLKAAALITLTAAAIATLAPESELYGDILIQGEFESLSQTRQRQQQLHICQRELP